MFTNAMLSGFELYPRWVPLRYRLNKKDCKSAMFFIKHGKAVHLINILLPKILFGEFILSKATRAVTL